MEDDILLSIARVGARIGLHLMGAATEPERPPVEMDKTAIANAMLDSCVEQASAIVSRLGIASRLDNQRGDFGFIVGIIAREQMGLIEYLIGMKVSVIDDTTRDIDEACERAVMMLQRGGPA